MDSQMPDGADLREAKLDREKPDHHHQVRASRNRHAGV